jgi:hypothetical protein
MGRVRIRANLSRLIDLLDHTCSCINVLDEDRREWPAGQLVPVCVAQAANGYQIVADGPVRAYGELVRSASSV